MAAKIKKFSDSTLSVLNNGERRFYVYCLTDLKKDKILYIGKGCDNRIFEHEQAARSQDGDLGDIDVSERKTIANEKRKASPTGSRNSTRRRGLCSTKRKQLTGQSPPSEAPQYSFKPLRT